MKQKKAIQIAIKIIDDYRRKHHAFDHNLYMANMKSIRTELAHKEYEKLTEVIEILKGLEK